MSSNDSFCNILSCDTAIRRHAFRPRFAVGLAVLCWLAPHPASFCAAQGDLQVAEELGISVGQLRRLHIERGMKNVDLLQAPKALVPRLLRKLEFPEIQRLRADFRLLQEKGTEGVVSSQAKVKAVERLHVMQNGTFAPKCAGLPTGPRDSAKLLLLSKSIPQEAWTWLGPGNVGGRTRSILIHPQRPDTMWAGSVGGGVWRTDDGGQQWFPLNDLMANLVICCMVMDPRSPDTIYAGTGEGFGNVDSLPGAGIFKTTDGGRTWTQLQATANPNFRHVNRLAVSPDGAVLLAATRTGIFRSADAGQTWTQQLTVEMADVDFHPRDSLQAVAGAVADGTIYHSTDGGIAWILSQRTDVWSGRVEVTYAMADPTMIYASVNQNGGLLCRSTDGGQSFSVRNGTSQYLASQGWYDNVVWAGDPTNPNLVIVGGVDLRRSMDGGSTLIEISCWYQPNSAHADHHVIVADPRYDGRTNVTVFFGNDGGIYKTEDVYSVGTDEARSRGWINLNNNYGVTQFYGAAGNVQSGTIVAGAQDNGTLCYLPARGAQGWIDTFGGDGGVCAADPTDPRYFYGEYVNLMIHRSADGGQSAEFICGRPDAGPQWKPAPYCIPDARDGKANFIAPFLIDPNQPTRILAGGVSLWRTDNAREPVTATSGPAWSEIKPPSHPAFPNPISAIAVARGNSDLIWVGHNNGSLFKTANGTSPQPDWTRVDENGGVLPKRYCHCITVDPHDPQRVYVTFGGYEGGNVWKTTDGGAAWTNISGSLPAAPVRSLVVHPDSPAYLYLGTEVGVFASEDGAATWTPTNQGPTNCSVDQLFWMGYDLVAVTHGRGLFAARLPAIVKRALPE